jgi:hypothetical protein
MRNDRGMRRSAFDPIAVEVRLVERGVLPTRADPSTGPLGDLEADFTEYDPRKWALWRISMVRQFQPHVLARLSRDDLMFLSGQSPEGYDNEAAYGVHLDRNKIAQNALRARVELETRTTRGAWWRTVSLALATLVLGALFGALLK